MSARRRCAVSREAALVLVPDTEDIRAAFPDASVITPGVIGVPHRPKETLKLRELGFDVENPALVHYRFSGAVPFSVQRATVDLLTTHNRCYVLNNFGTGKTLSALWAFDYLRSVGEATRLLVVAPLSTLRAVWAAEIYRRLPHLKVVVLHGTRQQRVRLLDMPADVYVCNHDGLKVIANELGKRDDIDCVVIDELTAFKVAASQRSRVARALFRDKPRVWGMTGSPTPNAPSDAHGQLLLVRPDSVVRSASAFRDAVMYRVGPFRWVPRVDAAELLAKLFTPAVRFSLDDAVELPEIVYRELHVPLADEAQELYDELQRWLVTYIEQNSDEAKKIVALNEGALWAKLLQVATGYVYGLSTRALTEAERKAFTVWPEPRLAALVDVIRDVDGKVIVWVPFLHTMKGISERLKKEGIRHALVSGDTPQRERAVVFGDFQRSDSDLRVLVAHPRCAAHGVTLTAAHVSVWFGPVADNELFEQANARIRRAGQTKRQLVLMLYGTKLEQKVYKKLQNKQALQGKLLGLLREVTAGGKDGEG